MTLPNFLIIGAQKSGTTWLAKNLKQHPDIFIPSGEIHFFAKEQFINGIDWYEKHFSERTTEKVVGEKSTSYLWLSRSPEIPQNILSQLPDVKLIAVLRNPVNRAISAFTHHWSLGRVPPSIDIDEVFSGRHDDIVKKFGLLQMGMYYSNLKNYYSAFPKNQLLILIFEEDIIQQPEQTMSRVTQFLGINTSFKFQELNRKRNAFRTSKYAANLSYHFPSAFKLIRFLDLATFRLSNNHSLSGSRPKHILSPEISSRLYDYFSEENKNLFHLLNRNIPSWKQSQA
ncbi:sulfotransferase domain-containing protein [Oscillatoria sp. CS-180]|uniref:sulfotransferase domain-containing protein n=1 Tax=Oscillatoria sp. CS-180 TaxID=3021720 RepID=UPI00232B4951|nr:sulfotransferase domain-containing protein [Oscillatoria sp. CS-180]MDB9526427.1 sulfotransferase domain-containing protein [Oscillatoria sp. CS-180]